MVKKKFCVYTLDFEIIILNSLFYTFLKKKIVQMGFRKSYSVCGNFGVIKFFLEIFERGIYNLQYTIY